eukprot:TRINITY_DN7860_c0_g1_i1.p1 TRINITY_DN7860_c0_g1~~TRINITY_DN7860_c0_g1_i1.p1  ORF type:complete len:548 (+),score=109.29 TRINITY_DN7860_c0_g1_i1:807-2450(+)
MTVIPPPKKTLFPLLQKKWEEDWIKCTVKTLAYLFGKTVYPPLPPLYYIIPLLLIILSCPGKMHWVFVIATLVACVEGYSSDVVSHQAVNGSAVKVVASGGMVYVADSNGVAFMHSGKGRAEVVGRYSTNGTVSGIVPVPEEEGVMLFADDTSGVHVVDVRNVRNPILLARIPLKAYGIDYVYPTLYIANEVKGLALYSLASIRNPTHLGSVKTDGFAMHVTVHKSIAYVGTWQGGLVTVDVADPSRCTVLGSIALGGSTRHLTLYGNTAYVASYYNGVSIVDVKRAEAPRLLHTWKSSSFVMSTFVTGSTLYVANGKDGLQVLDITNTSALSFVSSFGSGCYGYDVTVVGGTAYVAGGAKGLYVLKVTPCEGSSVLEATQMPEKQALEPAPLVSGAHGWGYEAHSATLEKVPRNATGYIPRVQPVQKGTVFSFFCPDTCDQTPCEIYVAFHQCSSCEGAGEAAQYSDLLTGQGWGASSCAPTFSTTTTTSYPLTSYFKTIQPGEVMETPALSGDVLHLLFMHRTSQADDWCKEVQGSHNTETCECP